MERWWRAQRCCHEILILTTSYILGKGMFVTRVLLINKVREEVWFESLVHK